MPLARSSASRNPVINAEEEDNPAAGGRSDSTDALIPCVSFQRSEPACAAALI